MTEKSLKIVGTFSKVLKKDGSLLFKPDFKDSDFLLDFKYLYHFEFKTKWKITSMTKTAKGFIVRFAEADTFRKAEFFVGEKFALPKNEIFGKSQDLLIGLEVVDKSGKTLGKIMAFSPTPTYSLAEVEKEDGESVFIPFTEKFFELKDETVILKNPPF
ncbi:PRC-barrel domain-containing protein [bacterium]|nr:PRC-barrel domain-containing protein [bacterium]